MQISLLSFCKIYSISASTKNDIRRNMCLPKRVKAGVIDSPSKE